MTEFTSRPTADWFWVDLENGAKILKSGLIVLDDNMKEHGIRSREGVVMAVSEKAAEQGVGVGDTVILEHLGWARSLKLETVDGGSHTIWPTKLEKVLLHRKATDQ